jgi:hypothetical protein
MLMALLVLSTILVTAVSVGQIAYLEIVLVKTNNETVVATYAAESALEQGAYRVRNYQDTLPALTGSKVLPNNGSWTRVASSTEGSLVLRPLYKNLTRGFDFYDPESGGAGGRESVKITIDSCDGSEWIELGYQPFDPSTLALGTFQKIRYNCTAGVNQVIYNNSVQATTAYRLYIRYVQGTNASLSRLTVTGCTLDNGGGTCSLPGRVDITATGSYRTATRTMDLVMPRLSPISGVFDYGIFSECQIIKDPTNPTPAC